MHVYALLILTFYEGSKLHSVYGGGDLVHAKAVADRLATELRSDQAAYIVEVPLGLPDGFQIDRRLPSS